MSMIISLKNLLLVGSLVVLSICGMGFEGATKLQTEIQNEKFTNSFKGRNYYDSRK